MIRLIILLVLYTLTTACSRESKFIEVWNRYDADALINITTDDFKLNGEPYARTNINYTMENNLIAGIKFRLDSIYAVGDSSILYTHWTSYLQKKYKVPPYRTEILLIYQKNKIKEAHFTQFEDEKTQTQKFNEQAERYLNWLRSKYPEIYNSMESMGTSVLDNDSLYIEYSRLLHLKLNEYHP